MDITFPHTKNFIQPQLSSVNSRQNLHGLAYAGPRLSTVILLTSGPYLGHLLRALDCVDAPVIEWQRIAVWAHISMLRIEQQPCQCIMALYASALFMASTGSGS